MEVMIVMATSEGHWDDCGTFGKMPHSAPLPSNRQLFRTWCPPGPLARGWGPGPRGDGGAEKRSSSRRASRAQHRECQRRDTGWSRQAPWKWAAVTHSPEKIDGRATVCQAEGSGSRTATFLGPCDSRCHPRQRHHHRVGLKRDKCAVQGILAHPQAPTPSRCQKGSDQKGHLE